MIVVKAGGASGIDLAAICHDIAALVQAGQQVILVHGGSKETNELSQQLGHTPRFLTSVTGVRSRYTDATTLDVLTLAMAGRIQPALVAQLLRLGILAIGLTGIDGMLIQARRKSAIKAVVDGRTQIIHDDLTGRITQVNTQLLQILLQNGYTPVLSPPVIDLEAGPLNADADRLAASVAVAVNANELVILSNVPGVLRDVADPASLVDRIVANQLHDYFPLAQGRMRLKLIAAQEALNGGIQRVIIADGRRSSPIHQALAGSGTVLSQG